MSLSSLLSIARGALMAQERAVTVAGHNIANAETPGYSRQRANLVAAQPEPAAFGQVGRGVQLVSIERMRSGFFDQNWRRETGVGARLQTLRDTLQQVSGIIGEPSDTGVSAGLDSLIDAFQTLASNPVDPAARAVVIANATSLADKFHSIDSRLDSVATNIGAEVTQIASEANALIHEVASLNGQIQQANGQAPLPQATQVEGRRAPIHRRRLLPQEGPHRQEHQETRVAPAQTFGRNKVRQQGAPGDTHEEGQHQDPHQGQTRGDTPSAVLQHGGKARGQQHGGQGGALGPVLVQAQQQAQQRHHDDAAADAEQA